jgi:hypothetical protein
LLFAAALLSPLMSRRPIIESELRLSLDDVFVSVDPQPLATASIAQAGSCTCVLCHTALRLVLPG